MPEDLEQMDDAGVTEDAGEECAPVFGAEPVPDEPPLIVGEPSMQKFKVNARHTNCPNRWQTVEAKNEEDAKRIFLAQYGGEIIAVEPGEAAKNER